MKRAFVPALVATLLGVALTTLLASASEGETTFSPPASGQEGGIACNRGVFTRKETRRGLALLAELRASVTERRELPDGWSFRLRADDDTVARVGEWMHLERRCCAFFDFTLEWKGAEADPWLTIRGPEGTKDILSEGWADSSREE